MVRAQAVMGFFHTQSASALVRGGLEKATDTSGVHASVHEHHGSKAHPSRNEVHTATHSAALHFKHTGLACDDLSELPEVVREAGLKTLEYLEALVVSACGGADASLDCAEFDELLATMRLSELKMEALKVATTTTVGPFVASVTHAIRLNPMLVAMAAEAAQLSQQMDVAPVASPERDADVKRAVVHCFLLDSFCKGFMEREEEATDPAASLTGRVAAAFQAHREAINWKPFWDTFGRAKAASIDLPIQGDYLPIKCGLKTRMSKATWGLVRVPSPMASCLPLGPRPPRLPRLRSSQ